MANRSALLTFIAAALLAGCSGFGDHIDRSKIRNVVVITLDTTRADHIATYGYKDVKTPNIDALAQRGVLFEDAITPVPLTLPSHTSIFTGQYPIHHGVRNNGTFRVPNNTQTMAEILKQRGFQTSAVIGAFVLDSKFGLDQGFDNYDDNLHSGKKGPMFMFDERPGRMVTDAGVAWLKEHHQQQFFLWLHYFDVHANYEPPPPFDVLYDKHPYDGEIAGVDQQIGRVMAALDELKLRDDTLVVLTADHGESLGEHGEATHSLTVYDATLHVPLIFSHPALPQAGRIKGQVRTIDILPTVLDLFGLPASKQVDGQSLVPLFNGGKRADLESYIETLVPRFNNGWAELRGVRTSSHKYIRAPKSELYDLDADPRETQNLLQSQPDTVKSLAQHLDDYLKTDVALTGTSTDAALKLTAADRERLAALGYNVDAPTPPQQEDLPDPKDKIALFEEFQAAQNLMRQHKAQDAVVALRALLEKDPGNVLAHSSLANALASTGQTDAARAEYEKVIALDPRRTQGRMALARLYRREGKMTEAFDTLKDALAKGGDEPELASEFADLFQEAGNTDKSIEWYKEALRRDPQYVKALIGMSNTYHRAGRDTDAMAALEQALQIDPRNADALYNEGVILEAQGKDDEAAERYRHVLEIDPDHTPALNNLASYFERKGQPQKAVGLYRRVIELSPDNFEAIYNLGTILLKNKTYEEAIARLEQAHKLRPDAGVVYNNLALAYVEAGRPRDAIALLQKAADTDPKSPVWWLRLARVEAQAGHQADAKKHFEQAVQLGGESLRAKFVDDPYLGSIAKAGKKKAAKS